MDLKYVARQLLRRPGHTLAVIACLVIGLVASVGTFSVITSHSVWSSATVSPALTRHSTISTSAMPSPMSGMRMV